MSKGLSIRQRRRLARLDHSLAGDVALTQLVRLFAVPTGDHRPQRPPRPFLWSGLVALAGIAAIVVGAAFASALGVAAAVAVVIGGTAVTGGLAVMLTTASSARPVRAGQAHGAD
ncbi:DUF3040 domain-containing protein [Kutzneria buriramensis]|uniref:DUF3040 family protein n=1 Tax=Kutzneria buriramensis TaxID=1045776 RepID=A0A3E0H7J4_9PSEU|nr:DUF3040 domain-containing protein [Kutzneria buriramensis]REH39421.1 Protein of unknown function (DUF3040) [Kutzneria buriramensis]